MHPIKRMALLLKKIAFIQCSVGKNHVVEYTWLNTIILQKVLLNKHAYMDYVCFVHK